MGQVIDMKKRKCRRCGRPTGSLSQSCTEPKCVVKGIKQRQLKKIRTTEIPSITIVLCEAEAKAVKKRPELAKAFETIARAAIQHYHEGLPKQCPKTGKPHRWETNYDETFCTDCHMDVREKDVGKPYVNEITLHYKPGFSETWKAGDSRKCSECGCRLWAPEDGVWADSREEWVTPPKGYVNCKELRLRQQREYEERRRKEGR